MCGREESGEGLWTAHRAPRPQTRGEAAPHHQPRVLPAGHGETAWREAPVHAQVRGMTPFSGVGDCASSPEGAATRVSATSVRWLARPMASARRRSKREKDLGRGRGRQSVSTAADLAARDSPLRRAAVSHISAQRRCSRKHLGRFAAWVGLRASGGALPVASAAAASTHLLRGSLQLCVLWCVRHRGSAKGEALWLLEEGRRRKGRKSRSCACRVAR